MTSPVAPPRAPRYMPPLDAWNAAASLPPAAADDATFLGALVTYAILAPSSHNTQPWRFVLEGAVLSLYADRSRALPVADPRQRELVISCGAALGTLRVAARGAGRHVHVHRLPDPTDRDLLARIVLERAPKAPAEPSARERALAEAIPHRHTSRARYVRTPVPPLVVHDLVQVARDEGATLAVLDDAARREAFATLVAEGDRRQGDDEAFRRELAAWVHPNRSPHRDGMPGYAFELHGLASAVAPFVMRVVNWGDAQADRDAAFAMGAPLVALLASPGDAPLDWLRTGEALAHVLLAATAHGLRHAYLNQPMEVADLRPRVAALLPDGGVPQLGLRFGTGTEVLPTPRRPVGDVLTIVGG